MQERRTTPDRRHQRRGGRRATDWLTPQEVGNLTGFSAAFIRKEIQAKELAGQWVQPGHSKTGFWRIHRTDAETYARKLGVWRGGERA